MNVQVIWEDDKEQISYKELNLHGIYNTKETLIKSFTQNDKI